jgi:dihydrofolate reductase
MRKVLIQLMVSVDGFFEGPGRELNWHNVDAEFQRYAEDMLSNTDLLLFGRVTYELMASYWPAEYAITNDKVIAGYMNNLPKIVFSKTLSSASWNNTMLVKENIVEEVIKLKQQPGKDITILGSSDLAVALIPHNLIDEFRIIVNPVILGSGKSIFKGLNDKIKLKLTDSKISKSGNVFLYYKPA